MTDVTQYIKPKWLSILTDLVRPGGIALMFMFITILPLIFALLELGIKGSGIVLASVLSEYFKAVPDVYYTTIQVMFVGYVAGKSGEIIATKVSDGKKAAAGIVDDTVLEPTGPAKGRNDELVN